MLVLLVNASLCTADMYLPIQCTLILPLMVFYANPSRVKCTLQPGGLSLRWSCKARDKMDGSTIFQPLSVHSWTSAFFLAIRRLCGVNVGRLNHCLPRWLRTGSQSVVSRGKIPWNTPSGLWIEPRPQGGQTVRLIHSPTELSATTDLT